MPDSQSRAARSEPPIAIRFRMRSTSDAVVARLLEAVRRTDLCLVTVSGDGHRVYPFGGQCPARSASSWRAELVWRAAAQNPGWHLEVFIHRAELFLDCTDGVRLEVAGDGRDPSKKVRGVRRPRRGEVRDRVGSAAERAG